MRPSFAQLALFSLLFIASMTAVSQSWNLRGQATLWGSSNPDQSLLSQLGLRYIPELTIQGTHWNSINVDGELSLNAFAAAFYEHAKSAQYETRLKAYRGWLRLSTDLIEARIGLQKINFGSATLFRPLMWFDKIDPRDPLQLTDGVYALLLRYYALNNATLWLWGLSGNKETKGWELEPSRNGSVEYGGRAQTPLLNGELALSYHHRTTSSRMPSSVVTSSLTPATAEDRFGLDGKWDAGIGFWFEAMVLHQQTEYSGLNYQQLWTLGADYTFDLGNGVNILTEYFRSERSDKLFANTTGRGLSAFSISYPFGIIDRSTALLYYDWFSHDWYRIVTWQRTLDNWIFYLLGFWNPGSPQLSYHQNGRRTFSGTGIQLMAVFNH